MPRPRKRRPDATRKQEIPPGFKLRRVLHPHASTILAIAFSSEGKQLAAGSYGPTVRVTDAASGRQAAVLEADELLPLGVDLLPDTTLEARAGFSD